MVRFDLMKTTKEEMELIGKISDKAYRLVPELKKAGVIVCMDIEATHDKCPLDLQKLLEFPDFDFIHDVCGIARHLDRNTGELTDCFLPRCAKPAQE